MKFNLYTIHAYRWGNRENNSYIVAAVTDKILALRIAEQENIYRGGKYECEVLEWPIDTIDEFNFYENYARTSTGSAVRRCKEILPLPKSI